MTVLIRFSSNFGGGQCDAKCYNAKTTNCDCICGGKNHGCGVDKAMENTREYVDKWIEEAKKKRPNNQSNNISVLQSINFVRFVPIL